MWAAYLSPWSGTPTARLPLSESKKKARTSENSTSPHLGEYGLWPPSVPTKPLTEGGDPFDIQPAVCYFLKPGPADLYLLASEQLPTHGLIEAPRRVVGQHPR